MRKLGVALAAIVCLSVLFISYSIWKDKLEAAAAGSDGVSSSAPVAEVETETEEETSTESPTSDLSVSELSKLTATMDEPVRQLFLERWEAGETVDLLILGSAAMDSGDPGYAEILTLALEDRYGDFVTVEKLAFDGTSEQFNLSGEELPAADILLVEPFTLKNNGEVEIEVEHQHIREWLSEVQETTEDAVLVLHPPQPIYGAQFYARQVSALKEFASMRGHSYIDHWGSWPETSDEAIKDYLTETGSPNTEGAEIWANELITYFIAE